MTEHEWETCTDPKPMLELLHGKECDRKYALLAVACERRVFSPMTHPELRAAVEAVERYAEGLLTPEEMAEIGWASFDGWSLANHATESCQRAAGGRADPSRWTPACEALAAAEAGVQARLIHDIFGNPFRPVACDPAWLSQTVLALAEAIYADRAFDRLPVLADALEEAGCDSPDILAHCRGDGPHVRGCWVIDAILGKE